jgi:hypothetical protein
LVWFGGLCIESLGVGGLEPHLVLVCALYLRQATYQIQKNPKKPKTFALNPHLVLVRVLIILWCPPHQNDGTSEGKCWRLPCPNPRGERAGEGDAPPELCGHAGEEGGVRGVEGDGPGEED